MFVSTGRRRGVGGGGGGFPAAVPTTRCHLQINNTGRNKRVTPVLFHAAVFFFLPLFKSGVLGGGDFTGVKTRICTTSVSVSDGTNQHEYGGSSPVPDAAGVKLQLVKISQQALLHVTEVHRLPVDDHQAQAPLEGRSVALAVLVGAA